MSDETNINPDTTTTAESADSGDTASEWRAPSRDEFERALKAASDASWATARKHYESRTAPPPPSPAQTASMDFEARARQMSEYLASVRLTPDSRRGAAASSPTTPTATGGAVSAADRLAELMLLERLEAAEAKRAAAAAAPRDINGRIDSEVSRLDPSLSTDARAAKVREIANRHLRGVKLTAAPTGPAALGPRRK